MVTESPEATEFIRLAPPTKSRIYWSEPVSVSIFWLLIVPVVPSTTKPFLILKFLFTVAILTPFTAYIFSAVL